MSFEQSGVTRTSLDEALVLVLEVVAFGLAVAAVGFLVEADVDADLEAVVFAAAALFLEAAGLTIAF